VSRTDAALSELRTLADKIESAVGAVDVEIDVEQQAALVVSPSASRGGPASGPTSPPPPAP